MSTSSLSSLRIENLRGAVLPFTLAFEKGQKLTIIYGENGTGKSTISDAFDLLGNANVGSLENRGVGGVTRSYWPSLGKTYDDVKVILTTSSGSCTLSLSKTDVKFDNEKLKPQVAVLRRNQILNLVTAQPAKRYEAISKFVDVSGIEASESALRKLILDKKKDYETATTRLDANKTTIENFWQQVGSPLPDAFTWAKAEIQKDSEEFYQRKTAIDGLISYWDKIIQNPAKLIELSEQREKQKILLDAAKQNLATITNNAADDYLEILELLRAAQQHFAKHPSLKICPLCESSEKAGDLVAEVNRRIESQGMHAKLDTAKNAVSSQEANLKKAEQRLEDHKQNAANDFSSLENYYLTNQALLALDIPVFPIPTDPSQWEAWIDANKAKREDWMKAADACVDSQNFLQTLERSLKEYEKSETTAIELAAICPWLVKILNILESERKKYTDTVLAAISTRVGELYEDIHQGEGLNKIVLALETGRRSSLGITTDFGQKVATSPQAYFSDSHLDTLGLCVFFALAERENPENKILVLDDVLGSVDEPHVERVIGMIYNISQKFQHAIVTTHYRPWREKFRWGILKPGQVCQFVELKHWSLSDGMALAGSTPEIALLKKLLASDEPDVQSITGKAGIILEAILDFLTLKYGCAVPRNPKNAYVLNELLSAVNGKLLDALTIDLIERDDTGKEIVTHLSIKPILNEIKTIAQVRNVLGAHFNAISFDLYPANSGMKCNFE
jgi:hypothetical protein